MGKLRVVGGTEVKNPAPVSTTAFPKREEEKRIPLLITLMAAIPLSLLLWYGIWWLLTEAGR
jgi:hypothetical protein